VLRLDELEQVLHFGAEVPVGFQDLRGVRRRHLRPVDQPVRLVQRRDRLSRHVVPAQADDVDAADLRRIAVND